MDATTIYVLTGISLLVCGSIAIRLIMKEHKKEEHDLVSFLLDYSWDVYGFKIVFVALIGTIGGAIMLLRAAGVV